MKALLALALATTAAAFFPEPAPTFETELLASFGVEWEGNVAPKNFNVPKLDPQFDDEGNPTRQPVRLVVTMPVAAFGRFSLSNPHAQTGQRIVRYSVGGYEVWRPDERLAWKRENGTTTFAPGSDPFDSDQPDAHVFTYAQGPWNGYGSVGSNTLGPNGLKTLDPGEVDIDVKVGHGFASVVIDDPLVLRSLTAAPGEEGGSRVWTYQRTFSYNTTTPPGSGPVLPYIPISFLGGTHAEGEPPTPLEIRATYRNL